MTAQVNDGDIALVGAGIKSNAGDLSLGVGSGGTKVSVTANELHVGDATNSDKKIFFDRVSASPAIAWDEATKQFLMTLDGTTYRQVASGAKGTATLSFGAAPGTNVCFIAVTGQTAILSSSVPQAWMGADSTADHNSEEHKLVPVKLTCGSVIAGTGFTIFAVTEWRLSGTFTAHWSWQ